MNREPLSSYSDITEVSSLKEIFDLPGPILEGAFEDPGLKFVTTLRYCMVCGGAYSIADAINVLEKYTGAFHLNDKKHAQLIEIIEAYDLPVGFQASSRLTLHFDLLSNLIRMCLENEDPNIYVANKLLDSMSILAVGVEVNPELHAHMRAASEALRLQLEEACTEDGFVNVLDFIGQIQLSDRESSTTMLRNYLIKRGYLVFGSRLN